MGGQGGRCLQHTPDTGHQAKGVAAMVPTLSPDPARIELTLTLAPEPANPSRAVQLWGISPVGVPDSHPVGNHQAEQHQQTPDDDSRLDLLIQHQDTTVHGHERHYVGGDR